jgi:hypothetical protein
LRGSRPGEPPERGSEAEIDMFGWLFFGDAVAGMPDDPMSPEGRRLWRMSRGD